MVWRGTRRSVSHFPKCHSLCDGIQCPDQNVQLVHFFITLAGLSAYGVYTQGTFRQYCILTLAALCACYTHNFAMISAVFLYILLGIALVSTKNSSCPLAAVRGGCQRWLSSMAAGFAAPDGKPRWELLDRASDHENNIRVFQ